MKFKIDTRQKLNIITPEVENFYDNVTEEFKTTSLKCLKSDIKNVILNFNPVKDINESAAQALVNIQNNFYESSASFVVFGIKKIVETKLDEMELLNLMNITPTESEAGDIVQMEELERELLDGDDVELEDN